MKQTPIQKLIDWLDKDPRGMLHAYDKQIITEYAQSLLPYERECFELAHIDGNKRGYVYGDNAAMGSTKGNKAATEAAEDYFTSTYNK